MSFVIGQSITLVFVFDTIPINDISNKLLRKCSRDDTMLTAVALQRCGPGSIPGPAVTCGLSLLFVLVLAPRVFLLVLRFFSLYKNQRF